MKIAISTIGALALLLCSSCYRDLDFDAYRTDATPVLNAVVSNDTVVMASVSTTVAFPDSRDRFPIIDDATVSLFVNGQYIERMTWRENQSLPNRGMYISSYRPHTGDTIKIIASHDGHEVWAQDVMPIPISLEDVAVSMQIADDPNAAIFDGTAVRMGKKCVYTYKITFTDSPASIAPRYYAIRIDRGSDNVENIGTIIYTQDPVFIAQQDMLDGVGTTSEIYGQGGRAFTNDVFRGRTYTMTLREEESIFFYDQEDFLPRRITLYSLSEAAYRYLVGILNVQEEQMTNRLTDFGLSEPVHHYSNVEGGTGIVCCLCSDSARAELPLFRQDNNAE